MEEELHTIIKKVEQSGGVERNKWNREEEEWNRGRK